MRPLRLKNVGIIISVVIFLPFMWVLVFNGSDVTTEDFLEKRIAELRDRLQHAESLNRERENDILTLRGQMKVLVGAQKHMNESKFNNSAQVNVSTDRNRTGEGILPKETRELLANLTLGSNDIQPPSMYQYLPHLVGKPEGLRPSYKLSQGRVGVSVVIGIPTIKRDRESYLMQILSSLLDGLNEEEYQDCLLVVFVAEPNDPDYVRQVGTEIQQKFPKALENGILEVIAPPAMYYPNMQYLKETFGDPIERVRWRTKQNLDFSFLMMYCKSRGTYYVQLEDDVITKPGYLSTMKSFALNQKTDDWLLLEFSHLGFIGKLFKSSELPMVVEFFLMFHRDKPIDWLLDHLLFVKVCNPEKDAKHCRMSVSETRIRYKPSLFQHIGLHSSLAGKVQKIKDKDFGKTQLHRSHLNPTAIVSTTLKIYQHYSIDRAYMGDTFFWGLLPQAEDTVTFQFTPPIVIEKYLFKSGNAEHPGDKFFNTTVEVFPADDVDKKEGVLDNKSQNTGYKRTVDGFYMVGQFDQGTGIAEGKIHDKFGAIDILRLHVQSSSENWVLLNEILIKPFSKT